MFRARESFSAAAAGKGRSVHFSSNASPNEVPRGRFECEIEGATELRHALHMIQSSWAGWRCWLALSAVGGVERRRAVMTAALLECVKGNYYNAGSHGVAQLPACRACTVPSALRPRAERRYVFMLCLQRPVCVWESCRTTTTDSHPETPTFPAAYAPSKRAFCVTSLFYLSKCCAMIRHAEQRARHGGERHCSRRPRRCGA